MKPFPTTFTIWYANVSRWLFSYSGWTLEDVPGDVDVWLVWGYFRGNKTAQECGEMLSRVSWGIKLITENMRGIG